MPETTEAVPVEEVSIGDEIWAPDDGDWFKVADMESDGHWGTTFYRSDRSLATFDHGKPVMRRVRERQTLELGDDDPAS